MSISPDRRQERCEHLWSRREMLQLGTLGLTGLTLPELLHAETKTGAPRRSAAKSCILFFMEGGPSHLDLWDMKPNAPAEIRGEFQPISTSQPGISVCEHLPMWSRHMHQLAQVRSVHHKVVDHNAGAYYALTGRSPVQPDGLIVNDRPENFPPLGSVVAKLRPLRTLPSFVHLPEILFNNGNDLPGQRAGMLGDAYQPFVAGDPSAPDYEVPGLELPKDVSHTRFSHRRELLAQLNHKTLNADAAGVYERMEQFRHQAADLLSSPRARNAFDVSRESPKTRERYGLPDRVDRSVKARKFGGLPHLGQCMLMARRLIEAGVRLVTVCTGRRSDQSWDTHRDHFPLLKRSILPYADRAFSALLEDMEQRGLLEETLVVAMGEFGRTPRLGQITSMAGADKAGRDHWPHCYTVFLAGGPICPGAIYGASDKIAAYPARDPVTPEDITATIYRALGIEPETRIRDQFGQPQSVSLGEPITALFG